MFQVCYDHNGDRGIHGTFDTIEEAKTHEKKCRDWFKNHARVWVTPVPTKFSVDPKILTGRPAPQVRGEGQRYVGSDPLETGGKDYPCEVSSEEPEIVPHTGLTAEQYQKQSLTRRSQTPKVNPADYP